MLKPTLGKGLAFAKTIPALVNLWIINITGKNTKRKEELMPMKMPKNKKKLEGNKPEYTDTNVFGHIPDVFVD